MNNPSPFTHKVVVEVYSTNDSPEVHMEVKWEPTIDGKDIEDQGYIPAAYQFIQQVLLSAEAQSEGLMDVEEEDLHENRTLN